MKFLVWLVGIVVVLFTFISVFIFTPYGNKILTPYLQQQIQKQTKMDSQLRKFQFSLGDFETVLEINPHNTVALKGDYSLITQTFHVNYKIDFKELSTLQTLLKQKLNGRVHLEGDIAGTPSNIKIDGMSNLAYSKSFYTINLTNFQLNSIHLTSKDLDLATLLLMLHQKSYITTRVNSDLTLNATPNGKLQGDLTLHSKLFDLTSQDATYSLKEKKLTANYTLFIPKIEQFMARKSIQGDLDLHGTLHYQKDLNIDFTSNIAGGFIDGKLHNTHLHLYAHALDTQKVLKRFFYPTIFQATLDGDLQYNINTQKGLLHSKLTNGIFSKNKLLKLVKKYTDINPYKEQFNGDFDANIDGKIFLINFDLFSPSIALATKKAKLNTQTKKIDALIHLEAKSNEIAIKLSGDVAKPQMQLDVKNLMINQLLKKLL